MPSTVTGGSLLSRNTGQIQNSGVVDTTHQDWTSAGKTETDQDLHRATPGGPQSEPHETIAGSGYLPQADLTVGRVR